MIQISPSLLAADFTCLGEQCRMALDAGADMLHFDVMDGVFVPNISMGIPVLKALKRKINAVYDVHLMIQHPHKYIEAFRKAGADIITVHLEACEDVDSVLRQIKQSGALAGLSINPATSADSCFAYLPMVDVVLVMGVEPGFGGQEFVPSTLDKISAIKKELVRQNLSARLEVDGGINEQTARLCIGVGADVLVAGSAVFTAACPQQMIAQLRNP